MKICSVVLAVLILETGAPIWAASFQTHEPVPAPSLLAQDNAHTEKTLSDYRGQVVLVNFWATWCPPCRAEMPSMERLRQKMAGRPLVILGVNSGESTDEVNAFLPGMKIEFPVLLDSSSANARRWKVFALPTSFLVDAEGRVRYSLSGAVEWDSDEALERIEMLLAEKQRKDKLPAPNKLQ
ncbi:MAG: TlpA disulfide reductase family protein [Thiobacillaceae bacterium]